MGGKTHTLVKILILAILLALATTGHAIAAERTNDLKPPYTPISYHADEHLARAAYQKMKDARLDKKYDTHRPFLLHKPSQVGEMLVAYTIEATKPDTNGYIPVFCWVGVNSFAGNAGRVEELPRERGLRWYVHLNEKGTVTGYCTEEYLPFAPAKNNNKSR